jgi:hypothetical protein
VLLSLRTLVGFAERSLAFFHLIFCKPLPFLPVLRHEDCRLKPRSNYPQLFIDPNSDPGTGMVSGQTNNISWLPEPREGGAVSIGDLNHFAKNRRGVTIPDMQLESSSFVAVSELIDALSEYA